MMKAIPYALIVISALLCACSNSAPELGGQGQTSANSRSELASSASAKAASATGTIESIDLASSRIEIAHGPVPALGWPAMTMGFQAKPEQLRGVAVGQRVEFEFVQSPSGSTITRISKAN
jgi:Cu(I)/Ag(I) efflux system protein CusF